jgi:phage minor structural protein
MIYLKEGKTPLNFAYNDEIIQEGNSKYQLSFKFPTNNPLWEELVEETLLLADDLHGEQEFIIFEVEKHHAYITVYANQVATLLNNYSITELSVNNASGDRVMRSLVSSIIREHKFTFSSDIANTHSLNLKNVTVATALFKDKHSILGQWGGDLIRDKYDIRLLSNGGTNKEALFMYKKNLKSYQQKKSIKDLRTRIHFTKTINSQKEGEKDKVIAVTVDSPLIGKYKNIYEGNLDVSDQDVVDEATLRKYGEQYFKTTLCDVIEESIEINVVGIPDEPVGIFDTVTIFHEKFNLDVKKKITKYTYSPMGRKLKTIGFGKIQSNLGTTLASMVDNAIEEKAETMLDAFKIQKNLAQLLKLNRKGIEDKLVELEEKSKGALEVKKALFEADGTIPEVVKTKILDAVEGDIGRLKTIITEAELIKAIQAKLNFAEIKNALIDKAFINQIISDEKFTQQFEEGQVTTQNIFTKLKDSIKSNISKEFVTKDGVRKLVNDLTIDADGIRQITQQESQKVFNTSITGKVQEIVGEVKKNLPTKEELKGKSSYIHKKYSDFADGRNMSDNSTLKYIGIYTGDKAIAPTSASEYSWTKIRGEDGVPGIKGADGRTPYFHTAYANSPTGDRDFSTTNSTGKQYIGTYSDFEVADSTDFRKYKWVKIKGEDGAKGNDGRNGTDGHSLTANLRFEGRYINSVTNNVKAYLEVFYDGQKITSGFNAQVKYKGGNRTDWSGFWNVNFDNNGGITNLDWGNREQNGTPLEVIVLVTYKGLNTVANARMENVPDIVEIKEITKKYKTFESTIDQFNSTIGEVKYQTLANEENRNLIIGSRLLSDSEYNVFGKKWDGTSQVGIYTEIRQNTSNEIRFLYEGNTYLYVISEHNANNVWQGVGFNLSVNKIRKGQQYTIKIPFYWITGHQNNAGIYVEIKNHKTGDILWKTRIDTIDIHGDTWDMRGYQFTADRDFETSDYSFWIYAVQNGGFCISIPYMCEGNKIYSKYSPAPEDVHLQSSRLESSIKQTKDEIDLKVSKDNVINAINISSEGTKITGTAIADYLYGKTIEGAVIQGNSKIKIGKHGYMIPVGEGLRYCLPEKPNANKGVGIQMLGNYGRTGETAYGLYVYVDPNFGTTETAGTDAYLMTVNGYVRARGINNLKFDNYEDNSTAIGIWDKNVALLFDRTKNDIYYDWGGKIYSLWQMIDRFYSTTSDVRLKKDIKTCKYKALDLIGDFKFKSFNWKHREQLERKPFTEIGLIAQDVEKISKNFVTMSGEYKTLNQFNLLTYSLKAIQELSTENQQLKSQLTEMNERLNKLEELINGNL